MKKPNLGKASIQTFFLNHTEKLVIGVCLVGLAFLVWTGFKFPSFSSETPSGLSSKASDEAMRYMSSTEAWPTIAPYRKASLDAVAEVRNDQGTRLDVTSFTLPAVGGPLVKIPGLRGMPEIIDPQNPRALVFAAPVLIKPERKNSKLDLLGKAGAAAPVSQAGDGALDGGRGGGRGGGGSESGASPGDGGRGGGEAGAGVAQSETTQPKIPGDSVSTVMAQELVGVRPGQARAETETFLLNIVQVTATVSMSQQDQKFRDALESARGYYPDRDRSSYFMPQLERQEEGSNEWVDITDRCLNEIPAQFGTTAPEIAAPGIYSDGITKALPPMTGFDYRNLLTAIGQPLRSLYPPGLFEEKGAETDAEPTTNIFSTNNNPNPENEADPSTGPVELSIESFFGSNMSIYETAARTAAGVSGDDPAKTSEQKNTDVLVRMFDLQPPTGKKSRYRLTVWLEDPNNTADDLFEGKTYFQSRFGGKAGTTGDSNSGNGGRGGGRGAGGAARAEGPGAARGGTNEGGQGSANNGNSSQTPASGNQTNHVLTKIQDEDLSPEARQKLREQRALRRDMVKRAETNPAIAKEVWKTYCLATKSVETEWVDVNRSDMNSSVALGRVHEPRMNKIGNLEFPRDEPAAEMVGAEWSEVLGAWVPGYRTGFFRRGETANFTVDFVHLLNPVDHSVQRLEKGKPETETLESELSISTNRVVVDISGGRDILIRSPLPNEWDGQRDPRPWTMPGESLVMDANGRLTVHSEFDDLKEFRNKLFIADETDTYGKAKAVTTTETDPNARGSGR